MGNTDSNNNNSDNNYCYKNRCQDCGGYGYVMNYSVCDKCNGNGNQSQTERCPYCHYGYIKKEINMSHSHEEPSYHVINEECKNCNGRGEIGISGNCHRCDGSGKQFESKRDCKSCNGTGLK